MTQPTGSRKLQRWMDFGRHKSHLQLQQATAAMLGYFIRVPSFSFTAEDDDTDLPTLVKVSLCRGSPHSRCAIPRLGSRGWTFQEKLLSSRFVQFGLKQIQWRCMSEVKSEDGLLDGMPEVLGLLSIPSPASVASGQISPKELHETWKRIAEEYSGVLK